MLYISRQTSQGHHLLRFTCAKDEGVRTLLPAGSQDGSARKYPDLVGHWQVQGLGKTNEVSLDA